MTIILYMVPEISTATEIFFVILNHFLPFYPTNSPKNGNIYKKMKTPGDIIILHKCTKTQDHRLHCSWDMVRDGCNCCFSFWAIFALLPPVTAEKMKTSKKKKEKKIPGDIIILNKCTKNHDYILYRFWGMVCDRRNCSFSFWATFCPFTPLTTRKRKISIKWKKH